MMGTIRRTRPPDGLKSGDAEDGENDVMMGTIRKTGPPDGL
jgi:hypothetical protein